MQTREIKDKSAWEKFLLDVNPGSLFQSWNWGEVIRKSRKTADQAGQFFCRYGFYEGNTLIGIAQCQKVNAKKGSFMHVRHGPVLRDWNENYFGFVSRELEKVTVSQQALYLRISPLIENSEAHNKLCGHFRFRDAPIHAMDGEYCWKLDLDPLPEEIFSRMRKTTRYLIRQAEKLGVEIRKTTDPGRIRDFLKLYEITSSRHNFVKHQGIEEEFAVFSKENQIVLYEGYYQKKLLSAALVIFYGNQAIYHHSASIEQKIPVNYLLQWEIIRNSKERGKKYYNMWGVAPNENKKHPWYGLSLFKKGFGGFPVEYLHAKDRPYSWKYSLTYAMEKYRKLRKGY